MGGKYADAFRVEIYSSNHSDTWNTTLKAPFLLNIWAVAKLIGLNLYSGFYSFFKLKKAAKIF